MGRYTPEELYYNDIVKARSRIESSDNIAEAVCLLACQLTQQELDTPFNVKRGNDGLKYIQDTIQEVYGYPNTVRDALYLLGKEKGVPLKDIKLLCLKHVPTEKQVQRRRDLWTKYNVIDSVHMGLVKDIRINSFYNTRIVSGIKSKDEYKFQPPSYHGSNGTYRKGYSTYYKSVIMIVKLKGIPFVKVEISDDLLAVNCKQRITTKLVDSVRDNLKGSKVQIRNLAPGEFRVEDPKILEV